MIYMCPRCEIDYGEPKMHPECDDKYCGREWSEVKENIRG